MKEYLTDCSQSILLEGKTRKSSQAIGNGGSGNWKWKVEMENRNGQIIIILNVP